MSAEYSPSPEMAALRDVLGGKTLLTSHGDLRFCRIVGAYYLQASLILSSSHYMNLHADTSPAHLTSHIEHMLCSLYTGLCHMLIAFSCCIEQPM